MEEKDRVALENFKNALKKMFGERLSRVVLFGSKARGEDEEFSDIDTLVVIKGLLPDEKRKIREVTWEISLEQEVVLTAIVYDEEEYQKQLLLPFLMQVNREAVAL